jgi:hypothetical protein
MSSVRQHPYWQFTMIMLRPCRTHRPARPARDLTVSFNSPGASFWAAAITADCAVAAGLTLGGAVTADLTA